MFSFFSHKKKEKNCFNQRSYDEKWAHAHLDAFKTKSNAHYLFVSSHRLHLCFQFLCFVFHFLFSHCCFVPFYYVFFYFYISISKELVIYIPLSQIENKKKNNRRIKRSKIYLKIEHNRTIT